jgi:hypothetical protein
MKNQNNATVTVAALSLPKGNGTIAGMGETLSGIGPDGMMSLSLPLPVSAGRGDAPALSLNYNSGSGNGPFGMGWSCPVMSIARRTARGVPRWQDDDEFIGPDGEVLIPQPSSKSRSSLRGQPVPECTVTRYRPRVERSNFIIEHWVPVLEPQESFWVVYTPDGGLHCLGKSDEARIVNPLSLGDVAVWLLQESVNVLGEHQFWVYKPEKDENCNLEEIAAHPQAAQRYLSQVFYGNVTASDAPFMLTNKPALADWLFCLTFDYGEYGDASAQTFELPDEADWSVRADCFSDYRYGFDLRTRRLCRQVLMYHRLKALAGEAESTPEMTLCGRMSLAYDESPVAATLVSVTRHAVGSDMPASLPPLEFDWSEPAPASDSGWSRLTDLANLNHLQPWQLVDLYGEGMPGILFQDNQAWWYRAPVRQQGGGTTWSAPSPLPAAPSTAVHSLLMDITRDGKPDWVMAQPGMQGYFTLDEDNRWSSFIPIAALPTEFFHPSAQLQDLTGKGNPDLVLIGPASIRLWGASNTCWENMHDVAYTGASTLPTIGRDARSAVVFSDFLGSGQQHLAKIKSDSVTVWPSLGNGQFGEALVIPGFSVPDDEFSPSSLYLADTDGSGSTDILYVQPDRIRVFLNQSGNRFKEASPVMLPDGVRFDDSCQIQVVDLQGLGVASVLLTVPYPRVQHWCCHLNAVKPWLLSAMNNNMGTHRTFTYRSSAQFWLDEKQQYPDRVCRLPFPAHTLWQQTTEDKITGSKLSSEARYYQGVWDARERELRGFAYVEQQDTTLSTFSETDTPPFLLCSWYATGVEDVDSQLSSQFWSGDAKAFSSDAPRLTAWQGNADQLLPLEDDRWWLQRALKGCLLRSESYGLNQSLQKGVPLSISESRWQVRRLSDNSESVPVVMPLQLESRNYHYECITADPVISQSVNLVFNAEGIPVDTLAIHYPRRTGVTSAAYPATLMPGSIVADSQDEQQQHIYLTRSRSRFHTLSTVDTWRPGLPDIQRTDVSSQPESAVPDNGFCLENLTATTGLMSTPAASGDMDSWFEHGGWVFAGKQKVYYTGDSGESPLPAPTSAALVAFTETAVFDKEPGSLVPGMPLTAEDLSAWEYVKMAETTTRDTGQPVVIWSARVGYTDYDPVKFYRPVAQRTSLLTGKMRIEWDKHTCFPVAQTDAAGLRTSISMDYRHLQPVLMTDINDNEHQVVLDGFGRPVARRFSGTEGGTPSGYSAWTKDTFPLPLTVDNALTRQGPVPLASYTTVVADSWMASLTQAPGLTDAQFRAKLSSDGVISASERLCLLAWRRYQRRHAGESLVLALDKWLKQAVRLPPHQLTVVTDSYDTDPAQQQRQTVQFSDGAGRLLQASVRHEAGVTDWLRTATGGLTAAQGSAVTERWAVSGRTEYNNKGLPVRQYQPFFLNDWRYVRDDSARQDLWSDTVFYDAAGREVKTVTAKQSERRTQYYPWFTVKEDENDTAGEVSSS